MSTDSVHGLGEGGAALYASLAPAGTAPARAALVLEAARTKDRLDDLNEMIAGKGVMNLMMFRVLNKEIDEDYTDMNINVEVQIKSVLAEARQQGVALKGLLSTLMDADSPAASGATPAPTPSDPESEFERRKAEKDAKRKAARAQ